MLTPEVLSKYHNRRREDLDLCLKSLESRDFESIKRVGHKLKGNGVTFGYPELSKLGEALEVSAQESNLSQLQAHVQALRAWLEKIEQINA